MPRMWTPQLCTPCSKGLRDLRHIVLFYNTWPGEKLLVAEAHKARHGDKTTKHARPHTNVPQTRRQNRGAPSERAGMA